MLFFERFDALCKQNDTSVNAVAKLIGVSSGSVTSWKNGTEPRISVVAKIAEYFKVSTDYLLGKTDDPTPADKRERPHWLIDISDLSEKDRKEILAIIEMKRANK